MEPAYQTPKALLLSLGGTPEPIISAIREHQPTAVCFFASQESIRNVGPVLAVVGSSGKPPETHTVLADDPEDLVHCYEKALQAASWIEGQGIPPTAIIVDYTGGTKAMTAALALATVGKGYRFSYVGGKERDKGGLGTVITGTEVVGVGIDPWELFAVEEERRFALAFDAYQFDAAIAVLDAALQRDTLPAPKRRLFDAFKEIAAGYREWDRFDHKAAIGRLSQGERSLRTYTEISGEKDLHRFLDGVQRNVNFLKRLQQESKQFNVVCRAMVDDLVANAERRAKEGKYDDAVARLYRVTEMVAQVRFLEMPLKCETDNVPAERVPEPLREEFCQRYLDPTTGKLRLPLYAAYQILKAIEAPEGEAFFTREDDFKDMLHARNYSLLAHGVAPVKPETFQRFKALISETFRIADLPAFPSVDLW